MTRVRQLMSSALFMLVVAALANTNGFQIALPAAFAVSAAVLVVARLRLQPQLAALAAPSSVMQGRRRTAAVPMILDSAPTADGHVRSRAPGRGLPS